MAKKFHVNGQGEPGACRASVGTCPFGSTEQHYGSANEARESYEKAMGGSFAADTAPEIENNFWTAGERARTSKDQAELMSLARGGSKRVLRELATNSAADALTLAEAATKVRTESRERKLLEAHPNFPAGALSKETALAKLEANEYEFVQSVDPSTATDALLEALGERNSFGYYGQAGELAQKLLSSPPEQLSDQAIASMALKSEIYARAAGAGGRFPSNEFLVDSPNQMENAAAIVYSVKGIQSGEKLAEIWSAMKPTDWSTWTAEELVQNRNLPKDIADEVFRQARTPRPRRSGGSSYSSSYGGGYNSPSSSDSSSIFSLGNPANPMYW